MNFTLIRTTQWWNHRCGEWKWIKRLNLTSTCFSFTLVSAIVPSGLLLVTLVFLLRWQIKTSGSRKRCRIFLQQLLSDWIKRSLRVDQTSSLLFRLRCTQQPILNSVSWDITFMSVNRNKGADVCLDLNHSTHRNKLWSPWLFPNYSSIKSYEVLMFCVLK